MLKSDSTFEKRQSAKQHLSKLTPTILEFLNKTLSKVQFTKEPLAKSPPIISQEINCLFTTSKSIKYSPLDRKSNFPEIIFEDFSNSEKKFSLIKST